jgi:hypothetical protein
MQIFFAEVGISIALRCILAEDFSAAAHSDY